MAQNKLRLLMTKKCNRACEGCCNKDWDLDNLPRVSQKEIKESSEVMITGGEPMLFPDQVVNLAHYIKGLNSSIPVYMYTAKSDDWVEFIRVLRVLDGVCLTIHENKDVVNFQQLDRLLSLDTKFDVYKSLRLNVFEEANCFIRSEELNNLWKVKNNMEWIKNCPLPDGEIFRRM